MSPSSQPLTSIKLRGHRKRQLATTLRKLHVGAVKPDIRAPADPISVVCISDTHNTRPTLPPGDILIHAGDLTENGSFHEVQAGLRWLSKQPHTYKILIAGNHDVLLDDDFLEKYPERRYNHTKAKQDLDWGDIIYLQDTCVTLDFPARGSGSPAKISEARQLSIFGSPWTPQYGISAFQYRPDKEDHWRSRFAALDVKPDIVITHGPPKHHLDARDFHRAGCPYLAEEVAQIKPRLAVFGHIHAAYGREDVVLDSVQRNYEEVMTGWAGWETLCWVAVLVLWEQMKGIFRPLRKSKQNPTTFVNAAIVGGPKNELQNEPIIVLL